VVRQLGNPDQQLLFKVDEQFGVLLDLVVPDCALLPKPAECRKALSVVGTQLAEWFVFLKQLPDLIPRTGESSQNVA